MVLADASIWIDHIRAPLAPLTRLLSENLVLAHSMVIGEVALGSLRDRVGLLSGLADLPAAIEAEHAEIMSFIEIHQLFGNGIGYVDVHLLAACLLTPDTTLWTRDKRLGRAADMLDLSYRLKD